MTRTRFAQRSRFLLFVTALILGVTTLPILPASADGSIDQQLTGDPACDEANYPGFVLTTQDLRQEFVPSAAALGSVDLCLNVITPGTVVNVNIYRGSATGSRELIRSTSITPQTGFRYVHVDVRPTVPLSAGEMHVIEIPATQVTYQWRAACGTTLSPCTRSVDPYPKGRTNFHPSIVDFGFRTRALDLPDLTGVVRAPRVVCPGQSFGDTLAASIANTQGVGSGPSRASLYLSPDQVITSADTLLGSASVGNLAANSTAALNFGSLRVPASLDPTLAPDRRAYVGLIVDDRNEVSESNEANNISMQQLAITACAHASVSAPTVSVDRGTTPPGAFRVPIADVDPSDLPVVAEASAPLSSFDVDSTPILPVDLTSLFDGAPSSALDQILLSSIPYCCWREILDAPGSPFAGQPLHSVSLADVLTLNPDVTLQEANLSTSGLKGLSAAAILSAGTTLNALGQPGEPWCDLLARNDSSCSRLNIDPARDTLLDLNLLGFRSVPWGAMPPVTEMNLAAGSPLRTTRLAGSTATDHYQILQTPFRTVRLATLTGASDIVDCAAVAGGCGSSSAATLADAENAGAFRSAATVGDLLDRMPDGATITLGEAALGIFARDDLAWEMMDHDRFKPQAVKPFGDPLTYTVRFTNDGPVALVDPTISVELPHNFVARAVPASITSPAGSAASEPVVTGDTVSFTTTAFVRPGEQVTLTFEAFPWVRLGTFKASAAVSWVDAGAATPDHPHEVSGDAGAPVEVRDIETAVPNDTPEVTGDPAAPLLEPDTLLFTTVGSEDQDFFRIPEMPAGTRLRVSMASTAPEGSEQDLDMALYRLNGSQLDSLPILPVDLTSLPVNEDGWEVNSTSARIPPEMLDDLPILPVDLTSLSVNRSTSDETMSVTVSSGDGPLLVQVFGYNGDFSNDPVVLRVKATPPPSLGPCTTPAPAFEGQRTATLTWLPAGMTNADVNTLFVFDQERTGDLYGQDQANELRDELRAVAARADLGVKGAILSLDADPRAPVPGDPGATVPTARAAAEDDRCSVEASNDMVRAATSLMADVREALPNLSSVVIAGNNDVVPHHFARDYTWKSNEVDNVREMLDTTGNTVMTTAMATRHFATDAPYGATNSLAYLNDRVYPPAFALGRLASEDAAGAAAQIRRFIQANGEIAPTKAAVASIDILSDGADRFAEQVGDRLAVPVDRLDDELSSSTDGWTADQLRAATTGATPVPGVISVGAHATHRATQAPKGGLFTADDVAGSSLPAGIVAISNGCHFGLNLPNRAVAEAGRTLDWTESYLSKGAAVVIGSAGFAYANRSGVSYSEDLMDRFASWIGAGTLGQAWRGAMADYIGSLIAVDAFDHKTLGEFIFNGMPHYRIAGVNAEPPAAADVVGQIGPDGDGLTAGAVSLSFDPADPKSQRIQTPDGAYYAWDGDVEAKNGHPLVARFIGDANEPGLHPQDILITGLTTTEEQNDPVFAGAIVSSKEAGESQSASSISPSLPARVTTDGRVVFRLGQFRAAGRQGGTVSGTLLRTTRVEGKVLYGTGGVRPEFVVSDAEIATVNGQTVVRLSARLKQNTPAVRVLGLFRDAAGWHQVSFTRSASNPNVWTGQAPLAGNALLDTFFQAAGLQGKVGVSLIKSVSEMLTNPISFTGPRGSNGWFTGPVTVSLDESGGISYDYVLNGVRRSYDEPFLVDAEGINDIQIIGTDHSTARATLPIDTTPPDVTIGTTEGASFTYGQGAYLDFACSDATSGIASCTATIDGRPATLGQSLTEQAGTHVIEVTGVDAAGLSRRARVTYSVTGYTLIGFESPVSLKPPKLNDRKAGDTIPLKWKVFAPDGVEQNSLSIVTGVLVGRIDCAAPAQTSGWGTLSPANSNPPLRYTGGYAFNAVTEKTLEGKCSRYVARHQDGSELMVFIRHTKA